MLDLLHIILSRIRRSRPHAINLAIADLHLFELESETNATDAPPGCVSMNFFERFVSSVWGLRPRAVALAGDRFGLSLNQGPNPEVDTTGRSDRKPLFQFALFFGALAFVERWWHSKDIVVDSVPIVAHALGMKSASTHTGSVSAKIHGTKESDTTRDIVYLPRTRQLVGINDNGTLLFWPWQVAFTAMYAGNEGSTSHRRPSQTVVFHATHSIAWSQSSHQPGSSESKRQDSGDLDKHIPLRAVRLVTGCGVMNGAAAVPRVLVSAAQVQRCHDLDAGDLLNVSG